nr:self-incompatibility gene S1 glycoprotein {N-terminal} [Nicotiana alata, styles, Peptide Partial, 15 aa] [Nicotiana alata]
DFEYLQLVLTWPASF